MKTPITEAITAAILKAISSATPNCKPQTVATAAQQHWKPLVLSPAMLKP